MFGVIFIHLFVTFSFAKRYDCTYNGTVLLKFNELEFFQTPNYPRLLTKIEYNFCNLTFSLTEDEAENHRFFAVFWFSYIDEIYYNNFFTSFEISTTDISFSFPSSNFQYTAIQGFILFDDGKNKCPMEKISENIPHKFTDENEIILIRSSYEKNDNRTKACRWTFEAPKGYGLKININSFDISPSTNFVVENTTDILLTKRTIPIMKGLNNDFENTFTYYNSDEWIQISLSVDLNFVTEMEFQAYISVVKKDVDKMDGNCFIVTKGDNEWLWTNNNEQDYSGYDNNIKCLYNLTVMPNTAVALNVNYLLREQNGDFLKCYVVEKNETIIIHNGAQFMFEPFNNDHERNFIFEFESDGSMQSVGFELSFTNYTCECANDIIPCIADKPFTVMGNDEDHYCGNLRCNFTLLPCNSSLTMLQIMFQNDYFYLSHKQIRVISNNDTIRELDDYYGAGLQLTTIYLNPANENILEIITQPSFSPQWLNFYVKPFNPPKIYSVLLSSSNVSSIIISVDPEKAISIQITESLKSQNISLIAYKNNDETIDLYNNESLTYSLNTDNCFSKINLIQCKISKGKFVIFSPGFYTPQYFAFQLTKNFGGCVFNNVIYLTSIAQNKSIAALANSDNECIITILIFYTTTYYISHMSTTASKENVKVFVGDEKKILYFEFNSKTSKKYQNIGLFTSAYTVHIPKNVAIFFQLARYDLMVTGKQLELEYPFQSFITTPYYGLYKFDSIGQCNVFAIYKTTHNSVKFTAMNYQLSLKDTFYFQVNKTIIKVNKPGDSFIFKNEVVNLCFDNAKRKPPQNGALFFIETIISNKIINS